ncbi:MAG TPA: LacI family DNA-binding transcriptional regulator [Clostridia bacterium]|nr:LacI family DNA-binding transcriptional regulator [Clostridia bacterium]
MSHLTIKDIARLSGTSVSTVSRVLNDRVDVSEVSRQKVLEVIGSNHYVPNNSARNLVNRKSNVIAVIIRGRGNPFFARLIKVIEPALYNSGFEMSVQHIDTSDDELMAAAMLEREKRLKGIIFLGGRFNYRADDIAAIKVPFVCCSYTNVFGALEEGSYSSVAIDDKLTARQAVEYLLKNGHRRIGALIERTDGGSISQLRYEGYVGALQDNGAAFDPVLVAAAGSFEMDDAYRAATELIKSKKPTAVFAISDLMAVAAMKAASDLGLKVPDDLSVIAIDGIEFSAYCIPALTTLAQPSEELALKSVKILAGLIARTGVNDHVLLETSLRKGGSVKKI